MLFGEKLTREEVLKLLAYLGFDGSSLEKGNVHLHSQILRSKYKVATRPDKIIFEVAVTVVTTTPTHKEISPGSPHTSPDFSHMNRHEEEKIFVKEIPFSR